MHEQKDRQNEKNGITKDPQSVYLNLPQCSKYSVNSKDVVWRPIPDTSSGLQFLEFSKVNYASIWKGLYLISQQINRIFFSKDSSFSNSHTTFSSNHHRCFFKRWALLFAIHRGDFCRHHLLFLQKFVQSEGFYCVVCFRLIWLHFMGTVMDMILMTFQPLAYQQHCWNCLRVILGKEIFLSFFFFNQFSSSNLENFNDFFWLLWCSGLWHLFTL